MGLPCPHLLISWYLCLERRPSILFDYQMICVSFFQFARQEHWLTCRDRRSIGQVKLIVVCDKLFFQATADNISFDVILSKDLYSSSIAWIQFTIIKWILSTDTFAWELFIVLVIFKLQNCEVNLCYLTWIQDHY